MDFLKNAVDKGKVVVDKGKSAVDRGCCCVCQRSINIVNSKKLSDGYCCKECTKLFSPYFSHAKSVSMEDIIYQVECRKKNNDRLKEFKITRVINNQIYFDENQFWFYVYDMSFKKHIVDVIDMDCVTDCTIEIPSKSEEVKFKDSTGKIRHFSPHFYAQSYDFIVKICVSIPYILNIELKLNDKPISLNQNKLIDMSSVGIRNKKADSAFSTNYMRGRTSNAQEVMNSSQYRYYYGIANEIRSRLLYQRKPKTNELECKWCGRKVDLNQITCPYCNAVIR